MSDLTPQEILKNETCGDGVAIQLREKFPDVPQKLLEDLNHTLFYLETLTQDLAECEMGPKEYQKYVANGVKLHRCRSPLADEIIEQILDYLHDTQSDHARDKELERGKGRRRVATKPKK